MTKSLTNFRADKLIFLACVLVFSYKIVNYSSFYAIQGAVLFFPNIDNTYWLYFVSRIPYLISSSVSLSIFLDCLMLALPLYQLFVKSNRLVSIIYTILLCIYFLQINAVAFHHYHGLISLICLSFITCFKEKSFIWQATRYYFLFAFFSASLWKLARGGVFYGDQMLNILKTQHIENFVLNPKDFSTSCAHYLISHPLIAQLLLWLGVVFQFIFIIGFFTKKYDLILFVTFFFFVIFNFFVMDINSFEFSLFALTLLPLKIK